MTDTDAPRPFRVLPAVVPENEHFWTGGAEGELRFLRCTACRYWIHPPTPVCPRCLGMHLARMETAVALNAVFDRLPDVRVDPDAPEPYISGQLFRAPPRLDVVWG